VGAPAVETVVNLLDGEQSDISDTLPVGSKTFARQFYDALEARSAWLIRETSSAVVAGDWQQTLPAEATDIVCAFWGPRVITKATRREVEAQAGEDWRAVRGEPLAIVQQGEPSLLTFRLWPTPDTSGTLRILYAAADEIDIPKFMEVPLALDVLRRERMLEQGHRDPEMANLIGRLSEFIYALVG